MKETMNKTMVDYQNLLHDFHMENQHVIDLPIMQCSFIIKRRSCGMCMHSYKSRNWHWSHHVYIGNKMLKLHTLTYSSVIETCILMPEDDRVLPLNALNSFLISYPADLQRFLSWKSNF